MRLRALFPGPKNGTWGTQFEGGLGDEAAEELFEEVGGYGGAIAGGGADVVDGEGFGGEGGAGEAEGGGELGGRERGVGEGGFGGVEANGAVG